MQAGEDVTGRCVVLTAAPFRDISCSLKTIHRGSRAASVVLEQLSALLLRLLPAVQRGDHVTIVRVVFTCVPFRDNSRMMQTMHRGSRAESVVLELVGRVVAA